MWQSMQRLVIPRCKVSTNELICSQDYRSVERTPRFLPGMKNILKSINQLDKSHTALMGKHDALERRVEVLEERKTEDSSLSMMDTIKEEVQEAMLRERKKTALIVRGVPEKGKDQEEIKHIIDTLEMTEEFKQTPQTTRLGKSNDRTKSRPIKIECETRTRNI